MKNNVSSPSGYKENLNTVICILAMQWCLLELQTAWSNSSREVWKAPLHSICQHWNPLLCVSIMNTNSTFVEDSLGGPHCSHPIMALMICWKVLPSLHWTQGVWSRKGKHSLFKEKWWWISLFWIVPATGTPRRGRAMVQVCVCVWGHDMGAWP